MSARPSFELGHALLLGLGVSVALPMPAPAAAQTAPEPRVTDAERDALVAAVARGDIEALRAVVGPYVLLFDGGLDFRRSSPEALIEATRNCRLFAADRTGNDPAMWFRFTCPERPRGAIRAWEEPGVYIKLWHHPAGMLASFFYPGAVEVRSPPRGAIAPPPPPAPPRTPNR